MKILVLVAVLATYSICAYAQAPLPELEEGDYIGKPIPYVPAAAEAPTQAPFQSPPVVKIPEAEALENKPAEAPAQAPEITPELTENDLSKIAADQPIQIDLNEIYQISTSDPACQQELAQRSLYLRHRVVKRTAKLVHHDISAREFVRVLQKMGYYGPASGWAYTEVVEAISAGRMVGDKDGTTAESDYWRKPATNQSVATVANRVAHESQKNVDDHNDSLQAHPELRSISSTAVLLTLFVAVGFFLACLYISGHFQRI